MLTGLDGPATARLVVAPNVAEGLRPLLPELAARAGLAGSLELEADPRLPEGAAQLIWPGGWLEHDPGDTGGARRRAPGRATIRDALACTQRWSRP